MSIPAVTSPEARPAPVRPQATVPAPPRVPEPERPDVVDLWVSDSFPASDPPGWWAGS